MQDEDIDFELLPEVLDEVREHLPLLEQDLHRLVQNPSSLDLLGSAFRHMHTIKGDFSYCRAAHVIDFVHQLEGILQSLRSLTFNCSALVAEALLQSIDQLTDMMQGLSERKSFNEARHAEMIGLIQQLAQAKNQVEADDAARHTLIAAHNIWPSELPEEAPTPITPADLSLALAVGKQYNEALQLRQPLWLGRVSLQLRLVLALNREYHHPCSEQSLTVAVYWHDLGLIAASDQTLLQAPTWKSEDWIPYCEHPERAANWLLELAPSCEEAAHIIRQHHQWANGAGFPPALDKHPPHCGAQMLACADLLHERVAGCQGEEYRRAVLRAVFDVNGGLDNRFDAPLINAFQAVARDFMLP